MKESIMQVLAANIFMRIYIVKIVCSFFSVMIGKPAYSTFIQRRQSSGFYKTVCKRQRFLELGTRFQFVKGKDFSNLVPDFWLEYHVLFHSV